VVHIVVAGYIVDISYFRFKRGVVHIVVAGYILDHYCLMFNRGVVKPEIGNVNNIACHNNMNHSVKTQTVMGNNIAATTI
jgi:hypothetical protein